MRYELPIFRPPSEASSLILQVSIGCSHNACTFCSAYKEKKFRKKTWPEIEADILFVQQNYHSINRVFLADGNALALESELLIKTLDKLYQEMPHLERVGIYAGPKDVLRKSQKELRELKKSGLDIVYFGIESGSDRVLKMVRKGASAEQMVEACLKIKDAGLTLSVTVIAGLGGQDLTEEHATETAAVVSAINPDYLSILTLMVVENTPLCEQINRGEFKLLTPVQDLKEIKLILEQASLTDCIFRCNHASNYLPLKGILNRDKPELISLLENALSEPGILRPEFMRGL